MTDYGLELNRMQGNPLDSIETWQCEGRDFDSFQKNICKFFAWNCARDEQGPNFTWQMYLGVLTPQDAGAAPHAIMARLISNSGFVQLQTEASHDVVIVMPVKGALTLQRHNAPAQKIGPDHAIIYQPITETHISHAVDGETCEVYLIKLSYVWVQRFLFDILQMPVERDLHLGPVIDLGTPKARVLSRLIDTLCSDAFTERSRDLSGSLQHRLVETFSHLLLESIPHRYSERMQAHKTGPMPNYLRVARDFMHREATSNPSMSAVARAANISVRTLETSFRLHLDVTPHAYLRTLRLKMAREALGDSRDTRPIAEVAAGHGFPHAGRFAQYYTELFGESPSQTRRKGPAL
jgi:AraC-like DNA-binding protein